MMRRKKYLQISGVQWELRYLLKLKSDGISSRIGTNIRTKIVECGAISVRKDDSKEGWLLMKIVKY